MIRLSMASQLGTLLNDSVHRRSQTLWLASSLVVMTVLIVVLILAAVAGNWVQAALSVVALITALFFSVQTRSLLRQAVATNDRSRIHWLNAGPDLQRQSLNLEVMELSGILEVGDEQIAELQSAYIVAEDLALRQIQQEEELPLIRHVTIGKVPFDALLVKNDVVNCIDVSFLVVPDLRQEKIDAMMKKIGRVKAVFAESGLQMRARLMLVLVTQLTPEDQDRLREILGKQRFKETPSDVDIRLLDFESLQKIYVTE